MDLEVVTVGTELLLGFTLDGNTADIGRILSPIGCDVVRSTSVPDDETAIRDAVLGGLARTGTVVVTGGLGPTCDDITKKVVAGIFEAPLEL
jgi:nicotinamide-nucleotide amidase